MLDGPWLVFLQDESYIGYFETDVGESRLIVNKKAYDSVAIGSRLFFIGKYDRQSREVEIVSKDENIHGNKVFDLKIIRKKLRAEEYTKFFALILNKPNKRTLIKHLFGLP